MTYRTIHTDYGLATIAQAEVTGVPINLTHVAVGDGNGNPVDPVQSQTELVRERYRATVNRVFQDPVVAGKFTVEMTVPASEGGFTIREIGVFDSTGSLFLVGNTPDTYKPNVSEGAYSDTVIRVEFLVTNATVVSIMIDPNVAVASQTWVLNNVNACQIIPGGTTGQILRKASNACGDTEWADATDANVVVTTIEEEQTLADGQTVVDLVETNTTGLAVYVEGARLPKRAGVGGWEPDAIIATRLTLGNSYAAGTKIICVQNEPASDLPDALVRSQNLADLENVATARTNLGVYSKAETDQKAPVGMIAYFSRTTAPAGWLKANGALVSRAAYADLWATIGALYGGGDGFTTFQLPDLRGEFIRGLDDGRGVDPGRILGSYQADAIKAHTHTIAEGSTVGVAGGQLSSGDDYTTTTAFTQTSGSTGGTETRPRNRALLACIKY